MKKVLLSCCILFFFMDSSIVGQGNTNFPWMFYPQQQSFGETPYCKKFDCSSSLFRKSNGIVTNNHELFATHWSNNPLAMPFDKIYSAYYTISTYRYPIFPKDKFGVMQAELSMNREVRYGKILTGEFNRGFLDPKIYEIVSDFLFSMVGKRYSKQVIINCFTLKVVGKTFDEFSVPSNVPISKLPLDDTGPGRPQLLIHISCEGQKSDTDNLLVIYLWGPEALKGIRVPN